MTMAERQHTPIRGFRLTGEDLDRLHRLREAMQQAAPGRRVTMTDVVRHALTVASGSTVSADAPHVLLGERRRAEFGLND